MKRRIPTAPEDFSSAACFDCGKLGGKCGKAHGIVEKAKRFTRYRLYMERQYTLRIHFYDMLRAGTLKSSVKWIGNVISAYTIKGVCFQTKQKARRSEPENLDIAGIKKPALRRV